MYGFITFAIYLTFVFGSFSSLELKAKKTYGMQVHNTMHFWVKPVAFETVLVTKIGKIGKMKMSSVRQSKKYTTQN